MAHPKSETQISQINALIRLVETLRGKNGCPWDKKQTPRGIMIFLIEEIYELAEAIESGKSAAICEELGDVLFHVIFIARLYQELGHFGIEDVARGICKKMIRRHPHVFGDQTFASSDEVIENWHRIKKNEKRTAGADSVLDSVPVTLPALMRAYKMSERAARTGFDWTGLPEVFQKLEEELDELRAALAGRNKKEFFEELGDVFFTLTNIARWADFHPESALVEATRKFEKRFRRMEKIIAASGRQLEEVSAHEKDMLWERVKSDAEKSS